MGEHAERFVEEQLRAALPDGARLYPNVRFTAKTRRDGPAHDGEADIVIVHPDNGLLVIEVKAGEPSRDAHGRWWLGDRQLDRSPFEQAEAAKHDLAAAIQALPDWPRDTELRHGHAVAFPGADLASLPRGHALLGPDANPAIVMDAGSFENAERTRGSLERAWAWWVGDGTRGQPLDAKTMARIDEYLAPIATLRRFLRHDIADDRDRLLEASNAQKWVLNQNRSRRRVEVVGPAGSGKSLVAVEKARRMAKDGWRTLFVCFNQPLATAVIREFEEEGEPPERRPTVTTFHRLCETLGTRAGTLAPKPAPPPQAWWDETLPRALDAAIEALPEERFHAIIVDEGQDFRLAWLESLEFLFRTPADGVLWVFHDPGQALRHDDEVEGLGLPDRLELFEDHRSPAPVAELAAPFYRGPGEPYAVGEGSRRPTIIEAEPGKATVDAVRRTLHTLTEIEGVRAWQIVVLSGQTASKSDVWRQRRFGNLVLWNGAVDDEGNSKGLPADEIPDEPPDADVVLFETVRRFKGLEREVVILCELPEEGERLDQLLYTGLTRATTHLVVIASASLVARLAGKAAGRPGPR